MRTKIGIVYVKATGEIRRIIIPDHDHQLAAHVNVSHDEKLLIENYSGPINIQSIEAIVQLRTGMMR